MAYPNRQTPNCYSGSLLEASSRCSRRRILAVRSSRQLESSVLTRSRCRLTAERDHSPAESEGSATGIDGPSTSTRHSSAEFGETPESDRSAREREGEVARYSSLTDYLKVVRRHRVLIIVVTLALGVIAFL